MMSFKMSRFLPVFSLVLISATSHAIGLASLEVEPYAGYGFLATVGTKVDRDAKNANQYTTLALGVRAQVKLLDRYFFGPEFSYQPGLSLKGPLVGKEKGGYLMTAGVVAGAELPILPARVWVGYNFIDQSSARFDGAGAAAALGEIKNTYNGSSFKVGASYEVWKKLRVNAEYYFQSYSKQTRSSSTVSGAPGSFTDKDISADQVGGNILVLSVSAPFDLMGF